MRQASVVGNKMQAGNMRATMEKYVGRLMSNPVLKKAVPRVFGDDRVVTWAHWFAGCNAVSCALNHFAQALGDLAGCRVAFGAPMWSSRTPSATSCMT